LPPGFTEDALALGFEPADDNEADALALLDWALKTGGRR
jgi:hypothetical protein